MEHTQSMMAGLARGEVPIIREGRTITVPREDLHPEVLAYLRRLPRGLRWYYCTSPRSGRQYKTTDAQLAYRRWHSGWRVTWQGLAQVFEPQNGCGVGGAMTGQPGPWDDNREATGILAQWQAMQVACWARLVEMQGEVLATA